MNTSIRMTISELTPAFIEKLKSLFEKDQEIQLTIEPTQDFGLNANETKEEYLNRIRQVLSNVKQSRTKKFTEPELDEFVKNMEE